MNALVFVDSFILIFVGVGIKGESGIAFGAGYGIAGGVTAILAFNMIVASLISFASR
jgi:hypothetical protein